MGTAAQARRPARARRFDLHHRATSGAASCTRIIQGRDSSIERGAPGSGEHGESSAFMAPNSEHENTLGAQILSRTQRAPDAWLTPAGRHGERIPERSGASPGGPPPETRITDAAIRGARSPRTRVTPPLNDVSRLPAANTRLPGASQSPLTSWVRNLPTRFEHLESIVAKTVQRQALQVCPTRRGCVKELSTVSTGEETRVGAATRARPHGHLHDQDDLVGPR